MSRAPRKRLWFSRRLGRIVTEIGPGGEPGALRCYWFGEDGRREAELSAADLSEAREEEDEDVEAAQRYLADDQGAAGTRDFRHAPPGRGSARRVGQTMTSETTARVLRRRAGRIERAPVRHAMKTLGASPIDGAGSSLRSESARMEPTSNPDAGNRPSREL